MLVYQRVFHGTSENHMDENWEVQAILGNLYLYLYTH